MRKIIGAINMTLDGYCDHTAVDADEAIHRHYEALLQSADAVLYGRITYQLMEFWRDLIRTPSREQSMDDFALRIDKIPKIVFSTTLESVDWDSARLATRSLEEEVQLLREQPGRDVLVGSRSLIVELMNLDLLDELQLTIHPVIAGEGLPLLDRIGNRLVLKLVNTKPFDSGAVTLYYAFRR